MMFLEGDCFGCSLHILCPIGSSSYEWRCPECGADALSDVRIVESGLELVPQSNETPEPK